MSCRYLGALEVLEVKGLIAEGRGAIWSWAYRRKLRRRRSSFGLKHHFAMLWVSIEQMKLSEATELRGKSNFVPFGAAASAEVGDPDAWWDMKWHLFRYLMLFFILTFRTVCPAFQKIYDDLAIDLGFLEESEAAVLCKAKHLIWIAPSPPTHVCAHRSTFSPPAGRNHYKWPQNSLPADPREVYAAVCVPPASRSS